MVGGFYGISFLDTVELLSPICGTKTRKLQKLPEKVFNAVGATLEGTPIVCGNEVGPSNLEKNVGLTMPAMRSGTNRAGHKGTD